MGSIQHIKLINEYPAKFFKNLENGMSSFVSSIPGMGLKTFTKTIVELWNENNPESYTVELYPHDMSLYKDYNYGDLFLAKVNEGNESKFNHFSDLIGNITRKNRKILFVVNKVHEWEPDSRKLFMTLYSLKKTYPKVNLLFTTRGVNFNPEDIPYKYSRNTLVFRGFIGNSYIGLVNNISRRHQLDISSDYCPLLKKIAGTHAGLFKGVLTSPFYSSSGLRTKTLLEDEGIKNRINEIFIFLKKEFGDVESVMNNHDLLKKMGIIEDKMPELISEHYIKYNSEKLLKNELTPTESQIFEYLLSRKGLYSKVNEIIDEINISGAGTQSDWALYRHMNNLKDKILSYGYKIESKRSIG